MKQIILSVILVVSGCASVQLPDEQSNRQSRANDKAADSAFKVIKLTEEVGRKCSEVELLAVSSIRYDVVEAGQSSIIEGEIEENWGVDSCGAIRIYNIVFGYKPEMNGRPYLNITTRS